MAAFEAFIAGNCLKDLDAACSEHSAGDYNQSANVCCPQLANGGPATTVQRAWNACSGNSSALCSILWPQSKQKLTVPEKLYSTQQTAYSCFNLSAQHS